MSESVGESAGEAEFSSVAGMLLVSVPDLGDDNFDRTVLYMLEHDTVGALGLVLNRPSETAVSEHLSDIAESTVTPSVFFIGGPVAVGNLMAVGRRRLDAELDNAVTISGPVVLVDPGALVNGTVQGVEALRLFTGYSGWGPGQLDVEIASGVWYVLEAMADDVLCVEPENLWRTVMKRQGGKLASQSLYPEDISSN